MLEAPDPFALAALRADRLEHELQGFRRSKLTAFSTFISRTGSTGKSLPSKPGVCARSRPGRRYSARAGLLGDHSLGLRSDWRKSPVDATVRGAIDSLVLPVEASARNPVKVRRVG